MPTYDYECQACRKTFEIFQSITEAPLKRCPACGRKQLKRLIGPGAGLLFKGSGFYTTDYRSPGYKAKEKAESEGGAKPASSQSSSTSPGGAPAPSTPASGAEGKKSAEKKRDKS